MKRHLPLDGKIAQTVIEFHGTIIIDHCRDEGRPYNEWHCTVEVVTPCGSRDDLADAIAEQINFGTDKVDGVIDEMEAEDDNNG